MIGGEYAESRQLIASQPPRPRDTRMRRRIGAILAATVLVAFYPVHSWVLAPAEVVPVAPAYVRAPFAGIVHQLDIPQYRRTGRHASGGTGARAA
ncbi:hypothetical protein RAA17_10385 [Komagataeibacter rhaeticus]|nr:hypothetical protein [Komagataeibacter rhaeticus]